ncbi:MAG: hypothetical protein ABFD75_10015 [Smithella sp.]
MPENILDFSFNMEGLDRNKLLGEAAHTLDNLKGHLGSGKAPVKSNEGDVARDFINDEASFAQTLVVYEITDKDFLAKNRQVPVPFSQLTQQYRFFWVYFPTVLFPRHDWAFNMIEMKIAMKAPEKPPHLQPKAFHILPNSQFQPLLEVNTRLEVRLDENFELKAQVPESGLHVSGAVDAKVAAAGGFVAGPFSYHIKKAKIQHTATGAETVFWRLDGAEFFQEDSPEIIIIAQIPKDVKNVKIDGSMQAYRYFSFLGGDLQSNVKHFTEAVKNFFTGGLPIGSKISWDVSPYLGS